MAEIIFDNVSKVYDDGTAAVRDITLRTVDGEFLVLVGPSGCGKSTLLRMIAGLEEISSGEIRIGDRVVNGLAPQERDVAMVFQNYALYPHMTVRKNLAFPLRMIGMAKAEQERRVQETARLLGLEELLERRPGQLSGGQRQRVAMGRALVREPAVFLLDEPLSNLDAKLRVQMRAEITALQRRLKTTTVFVTHDQVEAMTMGDRLAVLNRGELQQVGTPSEIYHQPANVFVATFIGSPAMNLFWTTLERNASGQPCVVIGETLLPLKPEFASGLIGRPAGQRLLCGLRPESFFIPEQGALAHPSLEADIETIELMGHEQIVHFRAPIQSLSEMELHQVTSGTATSEASDKSIETLFAARLPPDVSLQEKKRVQLGMDFCGIHLFEPDGRAVGFVSPR